MGKAGALTGGIILSVLGVAFFMERGFFASTFLGAFSIGNFGWDSDDEYKMMAFAVAGIIVFIFGISLTINGVLMKEANDDEE